MKKKILKKVVQNFLYKIFRTPSKSSLNRANKIREDSALLEERATLGSHFSFSSNKSDKILDRQTDEILEGNFSLVKKKNHLTKKRPIKTPSRADRVPNSTYETPKRVNKILSMKFDQLLLHSVERERFLNDYRNSPKELVPKRFFSELLKRSDNELGIDKNQILKVPGFRISGLGMNSDLLNLR